MKKGIGLILITHGDLGHAVIRSGEFILGTCENVVALSVVHETSIEGLNQALEDAVNQLNAVEGLVILTDIPGGTPSKVAMKYAITHNNVIAYCGLNMSIYLELMLQNASFDSLCDVIQNANQQGFKQLRMEEELEDDQTL